ncbi:tetratricopeptide repeat protein [Lyngbya sp. CCY1209]|uniref:tetratricopeptide repeat protein n=1 Tax=Lyngbya sp. CCY1209 TaxID=2886103 RepID=UPI002D206834|nr:tetratricopeptide repeat protein [Lyngbya sp. CCY1209]MEB3885542.1 tetratricopeptide repeat protein [Lyngbya sp. CCY1209]
MNGTSAGIRATVWSWRSGILAALMLISESAIATHPTLAQIEQLPNRDRPSIPPVNWPRPQNPIIIDVETPEPLQPRNPILPAEVEETPSIPVPDPLQSVPIPPSPDLGASDALEGLEDFDYWANLCHLLADQQEYGKGLAACDRAIVLKPKAAEIWAERTHILLATKQYTEAIASADMTLERESKYSLVLAYRCAALSALGRYEEAMENCDRALEIDRNWEDATPAVVIFQKGLILERQNQYEVALETYEAALKLEPDNSQTWLHQCHSWYQLEEPYKAIAACEKALKIDRNWGESSADRAWKYRGFASINLGNYEEASTSFDRALNLNEDDPTLWAAQGFVFSVLNRDREALNAYERAIALRPDYSYALVNQCRLSNDLGQYQAAQKACEAALEGDGFWDEWGSAPAWSQLGVALAAQGQLEEASIAANRAVGFQPDYAEAWNNRAVILWYRGDYLAALESVDRAIQLDPNSAKAWQNRGRVLASLERFEEAIKAYNLAVELDPENPDLWSSRSVALWQAGDYAEAVISAKEAVIVNPEFFQGWYNMGTAFIALEEYEDAVFAYQQATRIEPENANAWAIRGYALERLGQLEAAREAIAEALKLNPNQPVALQIQYQLETELSNRQPPPSP